VVQVAESYRHLQEVQNQLLLLLAVGIPLTLLASGAGGWFLASSALDPIDRITRTARRISARDLHQRLDLSLPNDEVGRLAATFDEMLDRLEESFEQQKRFIADASHELKTPLTVLKGDVDVALSRPRSPKYYQDTLERVNNTTDRLTALVQELLLLSRADSNRMLLKPEIFNLTNLLTNEVATLMPRAIDKQIALHLDTPDTLLIEADRAKLSRLLTNLIENAIKYCRPNDSITVSAAQQDEQICVTIADTGPGIHPDHLPHLFDRFYRVNKARSRAIADDAAAGTDDISGSGAGLGLSIVQWLAQTHRGRVEVESRLKHGTTFTVWLPRKQGINSER
jgi:heavy metal sensor kinase